MAKAKRKKTKKDSVSKKKADPKIQEDFLSLFLEDKIKIRDMPNVKMVRSHFLWEKGSTQRYRINVWVEEYVDGRYCPKNYIKHSFFVRYDTKTKEIEDLTIEQTLDLETMKRSMF